MGEICLPSIYTSAKLSGDMVLPREHERQRRSGLLLPERKPAREALLAAHPIVRLYPR